MKIGVLMYPTGYHVAAWRSEAVNPGGGVDLKTYVESARIAERGGLDFIFLADSLTVQGDDYDALSRIAIRYVSQFEPITLLSALAAATDRIGLVTSATTTYYSPYLLARQLASLDHLSGGRAGWNVVTSKNTWEAYQFGYEAHPDSATRYARAHEFVGLVKSLWDSWEDDAFPRDQETGLFFDPRKVHPAHHKGDSFDVRGPLNLPRPPQGHPVIFQAGTSDAGRELAASHAEVVYTVQSDIEGAKAFYTDVKARARAKGRDPSSILILVGIVPFVGLTETEALAKLDALKDKIHPDVARQLLAEEMRGVDLTRYRLTDRVADFEVQTGGGSRQAFLLERGQREGFTFAELANFVAISRGHLQIVGTGETISDVIQSWIEQEAADGFLFMPATTPGSLTDFVDHVVPELVRRGLFEASDRTETLRARLGFARPEHPAVKGTAGIQFKAS